MLAALAAVNGFCFVAGSSGIYLPVLWLVHQQFHSFICNIDHSACCGLLDSEGTPLLPAETAALAWLLGLCAAECFWAASRGLAVVE